MRSRRTKPERLAKVPVDAVKGGGPGDRPFDRRAGPPAPPRCSTPRARDHLQAVGNVFVGEDATLVEVNPLVRTARRSDPRAGRQGHARREPPTFPSEPGHAEFEDKDATDPLGAQGQGRTTSTTSKLDGEVGIIGKRRRPRHGRRWTVVAYAGEKARAG